MEDVVVDNTARGRGVGAALTRQRWNAPNKPAHNHRSHLTPSRQAANHPYETEGFQRRKPFIYRVTLAHAPTE